MNLVRSDKGAYPVAASPHPPCDSTPASIWPSPRQMLNFSCPYPSDRPPPDAATKDVGTVCVYVIHKKVASIFVVIIEALGVKT